MTLAVIVQARFGSSRLPGKILNPLGSKTALARVLDRCARIAAADTVIVAVPDSAENDPVAEAAQAAGYAVARGPEDDVLTRYANAARAVEAESVMRVTSDCPFLDPRVCDQVIALWRETPADYVNNTAPPLFPHGLDCEVFSAELLFEAEAKATDAAAREHVTPWIRAQAHLTLGNLTGPGDGVERMRWTLDYPEDLTFCQAVYAHLGEEQAAVIGWAELAEVCRRHPELTAINAKRHDTLRLARGIRASLQRRWAG